MKYTKKEVQLSNGEIYAYLEEGKGDKTIVLVHGNMSSSVHFLPLMKNLAKTMRVVAMDLRGFGDSSYYERFDSLRDLAEDIHLFLDALKIASADFVGWSTGGGIILELAAMYPDVVNSLILIESASHKGYPIFQKDAQNQAILGKPYTSKEDMEKDPIQVLPAIEAMKKKDFAFMNWLWDISIYTVNKPDPVENKVWIEETLKQRNLIDIDWALATFNMSDQPNFYVPGQNTITHVKAKSLHIWSKNDLVVLEYMVQENVNALQDTATYKVYEKGGHSPIVDNLEQLTQDILSFI